MSLDGGSIFPRTVDGLDDLDLDNIEVRDTADIQELEVLGDGLIQGNLTVVGTINGGTGGGGSSFPSLSITDTTGTTLISLSTDDSTSPTTGASVFDGGVGIAKSVFVGGNVNTDGNLGVKSAKLTSNGDDIFVNANGSNVYLRPTEGSSVGQVFVSPTQTSIKGTSGDSFTIQVSSGDAVFESTTESSSGITGSVVFKGGVGIGKSLFVDGTTASTSGSTGSAVFKGGVGIAKNLFVDSTNASTSKVTGSIVTAGGIGASGTATVDTLVVTSNKDGETSGKVSNTDHGESSTAMLKLENDTGTADFYLNSSAVILAPNTCTLKNNVGPLEVSSSTGSMTITNELNTDMDITSTGIVTGGDFNTAGDLILQYASKIRLSDNFLPNANILSISFDEPNGLSGNGTYLSTPGAGVGGSATPVFGVNAVQTKVMVTTESTSSTTGALRVLGGGGFDGNVNTNGYLGVKTGKITSSGNDIFVNANGGNVYLRPTEGSSVGQVYASPTSTVFTGTSGDNFTIQVSSGDAVFESTTDSSSEITGSVVFKGGVGIGKSLFIDGSLGIKAAKITSNGDDIFVNANGSDVYLRPTRGSSVGQVFISPTQTSIKGTSGDSFIIQVSSGDAVFESTTESSSGITGSVVFKGGVGIGRSLYVEGSLGVKAAKLTSNGDDIFVNANGSYVYLRPTRGSSVGQVYASPTSTVFTGTSGANFTIQVSSGNAVFNSTTESSSGITGSVVFKGGVGIGKSLFVDGANESTSPTTGALQVLGGIGAAKNIHSGGNIEAVGSVTAASFVGGQSGSFTPTFVTGTSVTYGTRAGFWYRLGNLVNISIRLDSTSVVDLSATNLTVAGCPFVNNSGTAAVGGCTLSDYGLPISTDTIQAVMLDGESNISFLTSRDDLGGIYVKSPTTAKSRSIYLQMTLFTNTV